MKDKLKEAFARVQAEEGLKNSTREFLEKKTRDIPDRRHRGIMGMPPLAPASC